MKKITLVYNLDSGGKNSLSTLRKKLAEHKFEITNAIKIADGFESKLAKAVANDEIIAVVGGDGTVSAVANLLANTKATLLPLPGGTLNHFTKDLDIEQNMDRAIAKASKAKVQKVDVATVNDRVFINNSSLGLYPQSLKIRENNEDKIGKWPAALFGMVRALTRFRTYHVIIDSESFDTPFIFVGNNDYKLENLNGTDRESLAEGVLSVYIVKSNKRLDLVKIFAAALFGKLHVLDDFDHLTTKELQITTKGRRRISVSHDGEVSYMTTPINYKIQPKSLRILK